MNTWLIAAAGLSLLTLGAHFFGGGTQYYDPLLASGMPADFVAVFAVVWHMATVVLAVNSWALIWAARDRGFRRPLVWMVAGQYAGFAALFLIYGQLILGTIWQIPQWTIFLLMAGLAIMGLRSPAVKPVAGTK
ncbi:MAG: hypothetical protein GXP01_03795 [Alphaproteobacteria bacterium]|nr:hypothetical protein [Alphaproteobacteria bacterium]